VPDGPTRRQVLAGGGLLGLGGLLGGGATEQVRAQQAAGQVGTESAPVDVHGATGEFGSLKADNAGIKGSGPQSITRQSDGTVKTVNHDTPQAAIDAIPDGKGMAFIVSKGGKSEVSDPPEAGGYELTSTLSIDSTGESRVVGTGIDTRFWGDLADPLVENFEEDCEIAWMWIDQFGDGDALRLNGGNTHVHDINIDEAGRHAFNDTTEVDFSNIGPYIEIKAGPTSAIRTRGNSIIHGNNLVKNSDNKTMRIGIWFDEGPAMAWGNWVLQDGNSGDQFGLQLSHSDDLVLGPHYVGAAPDVERFIPGAVGPSVAAYEVRSSNITAHGLVEDGTCGAGVRINTDVSNVRLDGTFPSGVTFNENVTTAGGVIIEGRVGGVTEATAGDKNGQVVNGNSWNSGDPNSSGIWNANAALAFRLGVSVWDTSVSPNVEYVAGPDGNWNAQ